VAVAISSDFHEELHALLNSQYCVLFGHQGRASGPSPREEPSLTMLTSLYVEIFRCWMEYEQRVSRRFLLQEDANANAADIFRRLQAQVTDEAYSIRSVMRWCQFIRQRRQDLHDDPRSRCPATDFIDIKILSVLEREPFHSADSLAEVACVSYSTHEFTPDLRRRRLEM
jgi:hypothetical protein